MKSDVTECLPKLYQATEIRMSDNIADVIRQIQDKLTEISHCQSMILTMWEKQQELQQIDDQKQQQVVDLCVAIDAMRSLLSQSIAAEWNLRRRIEALELKAL